MAEEYKSIKIKEDVKNRLDRYKKRCSYSDCLDEMLGYFETTGCGATSWPNTPNCNFCFYHEVWKCCFIEENG